jgi:hypothetical protein
MYGGNFWNWFFDKAGLLPEGYEAIPYSGEHADLYKKGELLGNSIPVLYGSSEFAVAYLQKMLDKVPYVEGTSSTGQGFNTFNNVKKVLGSAGEGKQWHHIVEQSQIQKSGFDATKIHNTNNLIAVDKATHAKISGYYNTSTFQFTNGLKVRDWLAGQSFEKQYEFGLKILKDFGVIK